MPLNDLPAETADRVGDCYRIEAELGRGGMARVYRVVDERSGQRLALKQLVLEGERRATLQAMFEREYHTLVQLAHPHIVRAFDYGLDGDRPYYTMELLEGTDVRTAARAQPLGVREICSLLRDAASALALIHSRRMVHRDLSPRNLWYTPERRAKLIDFGTLVGMGPHARAAGTAPFVPPEAVYMQSLDGRCDLYALGALAYFLITQRNAYPARDISELRNLWKRRPKRPDALKPEIPPALADLVMALLSLDARGRPPSAAEVCERLTALADLPAEDERPLAQAFLTSPTLVGREQSAAFLRKRLLRARRGRGNTVAIVAPAGYGRSRLLASCVLEAKLIGAAALSVDAAAAGPEAFALAALIAERLLDVVPLAAAQAGARAGVLGHVSPALRRAFGDPELTALSSYERTGKLSSAFVELIAAASRDQHLLIAVDDVHRCDPPSLGVLARVASLASARLLLLTTCDAAALSPPSPALEALMQPRDRIEITALAAEDTRVLLGSLFGEVPGLDAAAAWLHELSQGSPQTCMQYAQYLVDHGIAQYEGGRWRLPERLRDHALPATLGAMLEARLAELSGDAQALALGLALSRDESRAVWQPEKHVPIEDFPALLEDGLAAKDARTTSHAARAFCALDELLRAGMVLEREGHYAIGQGAMADVLLRTNDAALRRDMHRRLANTFARAGREQHMPMAQHLQRAGEHVRARALIAAAAAHLGGSGTMNWRAMRVSHSAACTRAAYAHWHEHGGSPREGLLLRRMLLLICSVYDWSLARVSDAQFARLRADSGLTHWDATSAALSPLERTLECLARAQREYDATPEAERGFAPGDAVRELAACALSSFGAFVSSCDVARARTVPQLLEPLCPLSPVIALIADLAALGVDRAVGRELGDRLLQCSARFEQAPDLSDVLRQSAVMLSRYSQAIADARQGRERALELAGNLLPGMGEENFLVAHVLALCHAFRGRADLAAPYRKQIEVITEDDVWRRKACLFIEAELFALTGDLTNLERTSEAIAALAEDFPGFLPWLRWTRGAVHRLRGELPRAQAEFEAALALVPAGEHRAWVSIAPALAEVLLLRGDVAAALRHAAAIVDAVETLSLNRLAAIAGERVRGLAESSRGEHDAAAASIERAFAIARELGVDGLPLAQLHEARARILLASGAALECAGELGMLRTLIEHADAPALIHAYEALCAENREVPPGLSALRSATEDVSTESSQLWTEVTGRLGAYSERSERASQVLSLLLEESGARAGHLFLFDDGGLYAAASSEAASANDALLLLAQHHLEAELSRTSSDEVLAQTSVAAVTRPLVTAHEIELTPLLLVDEVAGRPMATGIALLAVPHTQQRAPRVALVRAISRCLQLTGDSVPRSVEG